MNTIRVRVQKINEDEIDIKGIIRTYWGMLTLLIVLFSVVSSYGYYEEEKK